MTVTVTEPTVQTDGSYRDQVVAVDNFVTGDERNGIIRAIGMDDQVTVVARAERGAEANAGHRAEGFVGRIAGDRDGTEASRAGR